MEKNRNRGRLLENPVELWYAKKEGGQRPALTGRGGKEPVASIAIQFTWRHVHRENTVEKEHQHNAIEVVYYIRGEGTCTVGGQVYPYKAGSVCYIPRGVLHSEYHKTETEVLFFAFHSSDDPLTELHSCMFSDRKEKLLRICTRIERENRNQPPQYRRMINALVDELLILLNRSEISWHAKGDGLPKMIEESCAYIRLNSHMNLSAMDIARRNGYSYDYFRHNFKKYCGIGLKEFILNERKNKVIEYLILSDKSIKDIAEVCNFGDVQNLSKCFKQMTGMSPSQYRKQYKHDENNIQVTYTKGKLPENG